MLVASTVGAVAGIGPLSSVVVLPNLGGSEAVVRSAPQDVDRDRPCGQRRQAVARRPYGLRHACAVDADPGPGRARLRARGAAGPGRVRSGVAGPPPPAGAPPPAPRGG